MTPPSCHRRAPLLLIAAALLVWAQSPRWTATVEVEGSRLSLALETGLVRFRTAILFETGQAAALFPVERGR
jgi:hypothetical protein